MTAKRFDVPVYEVRDRGFGEFALYVLPVGGDFNDPWCWKLVIYGTRAEVDAALQVAA